MDLRTCTGCEENKPETTEYFHRNKLGRKGLKSVCKICVTNYCLGWQRRNREKCREASQRHYWNYKDKINAKTRKWYDSGSGVNCLRKHHLKKTFGITLEDYDYMLYKQDYRCAVCGSDYPGCNGKGKRNSFCVDHDHETNKVRGLLCRNCNTGIGLLGDNIKGLEKAIKYLEKGYD